jgi:hypothetical protein
MNSVSCLWPNHCRHPPIRSVKLRIPAWVSSAGRLWRMVVRESIVTAAVDRGDFASRRYRPTMTLHPTPQRLVSGASFVPSKSSGSPRKVRLVPRAPHPLPQAGPSLAGYSLGKYPRQHYPSQSQLPYGVQPPAPYSHEVDDFRTSPAIPDLP